MRMYSGAQTLAGGARGGASGETLSGAVLEGNLDGWAGAISSEGVSGLQGEDSECRRGEQGPCVRGHRAAQHGAVEGPGTQSAAVGFLAQKDSCQLRAVGLDAAVELGWAVVLEAG